MHSFEKIFTMRYMWERRVVMPTIMHLMRRFRI